MLNNIILHNNWVNSFYKYYIMGCIKEFLWKFLINLIYKIYNTIFAVHITLRVYYTSVTIYINIYLGYKIYIIFN